MPFCRNLEIELILAFMAVFVILEVPRRHPSDLKCAWHYLGDYSLAYTKIALTILCHIRKRLFSHESFRLPKFCAALSRLWCISNNNLVAVPGFPDSFCCGKN